MIDNIPNKASPTQMRQSLEMVEQFKKAGVWFVPVPVMGESEFTETVKLMFLRLEAMYQAAKALGE